MPENIQAIIAIIGAIAFFAGLFGGFKAKDIDVPALPHVLRIISAIVGILFIGIAVWPFVRDQVLVSPTPTTVAELPTNTPIPPTNPTVEKTLSPTPESPKPPTDVPATKTATLTPTPKPRSTRTPTSTPAPGTVLFAEDFEDGLANGFLINAGDWQVIEEPSGNKVYEAISTGSSNWPGAWFGEKEWKDYTVEYRVKLVDFPSQSDAPLANVYFREKYIVGIVANVNWMSLNFDISGKWDPFTGSSYNFKRDEWYSIRIEAIGQNLKVYLNDNLQIVKSDTRSSSGRLMLHSGPNSIVQFDDIRVIAQ